MLGFFDFGGDFDLGYFMMFFFERVGFGREVERFVGGVSVVFGEF